MKKYCDCFNIGAKCDEEQCRCVDCENYPSDDDNQGEESSNSFVDEKDDIEFDDDEDEDPNTYDDYGPSDFFDSVQMSIALGKKASSTFQVQDDITAV